MDSTLARLVLLGLVAATLGPPGPAGADDSPQQRVNTIAASAWNGPEFRQAVAELDADRAAARLTAHPGAPYTEMQREGLGSGLDEADNAAWYLRFGAPVNAPWQRPAIRAALTATDRYLAAQRRVLALQTAGDAVGAWLQLAAVEARLAVTQSQANRLSEALTLQEKRLELGEISGAEVTQLELERHRLRSMVSRLRAQRATAARALERWTGPDAPRPLPGDLRALQESLSPMDRASPLDIEARLEASPALTAASLNSARVHREGLRDRRMVWGTPEAEVSWERIPTIGSADGFDAVGVRLRVPLPIGGLGKRQAAEARARRRVADADRDRARRALAAAIRSATERALAAAEGLEALVTVEQELARIERSVSERYRLGAVPYLEYIDGLQRLDEVRILIIDTRLDRLQARLELAVLAGDPTLFPLPEPGMENVP